MTSTLSRENGRDGYGLGRDHHINAEIGDERPVGGIVDQRDDAFGAITLGGSRKNCVGCVVRESHMQPAGGSLTFCAMRVEQVGDGPFFEAVRKALLTVKNHQKRILERWTSTHGNARIEAMNGLFQAARARARGYSQHPDLHHHDLFNRGPARRYTQFHLKRRRN